VAFLLFITGVQSNPGPSSATVINTVHRFRFVTVQRFNYMGCFNARSVQSRAALIHDLITDNNIDISVLQGTWLPSYSHPAIECDIALLGYTVKHVRRPSVALVSPLCSVSIIKLSQLTGACSRRLSSCSCSFFVNHSADTVTQHLPTLFATNVYLIR